MNVDVVVVGEVLVELSTAEPLESATSMRLGFSGDALNAAAAAAAAGAAVTLVANVADDEIGAALIARVAALGIDPAGIHRVAGQHGVYFTSADPTGERAFVYVRRGSAGATLSPADLDRVDLAAAGVTLCTGVTCALSDSASATVIEAACRARRFVYDPNLRTRLTTPAHAYAWLARLAPRAAVVTPSCPAETSALLGTVDPRAAAAAVRSMGAAAAAVTCGPGGVLLDDGRQVIAVPAAPAPEVVDQTGAGDVFAGTLAARIALGDDLVTAARVGTAAAALSLRGQGGTGFVPPLRMSLDHLAATSARGALP